MIFVNARDARSPKSPADIFLGKILKICSLKRNFKLFFSVKLRLQPLSYQGMKIDVKRLGKSCVSIPMADALR